MTKGRCSWGGKAMDGTGAGDKKIRIGLIFGGRSGEHEVSIVSARSIYQALSPERYEVVPIGVDKNGGWHVLDTSKLLGSGRVGDVVAGESENLVHVPFAGEIEKYGGTIDVFFPITHGTFGEDGTLQGYLELLNVPYVGAGVLGSAVGMDKDVQKRLLSHAGIPVARFLVLREMNDNSLHQATEFGNRVGYPVFVKPANMGSSVGVSKVDTAEGLGAALNEAFLYDTKVLIEEGVSGREIECSVLGNEHPRVSVPGEVKPTHDFYDYEAKYIDEHGAELEIPARLTAHQRKLVQDTALAAYNALECEGMARVDMFLPSSGIPVVNEINTLPGFTSISMYPKLWEATGLSYSQLLDSLIELAISRHEKRSSLHYFYPLH